MTIQIVNFGKHKGKSIEQIAINDYLYFCWLRKTIKNPKLKARAEEIYKALNCFETKELCKGKDCKKPARYMSLVLSFDSFSSKLIDVAESADFVFCSRDCFKNPSYFVHENARLYEIKWDIIEKIYDYHEGLYIPKYILNDLSAFLLKLMGFEGKKTKEKLKKLIDDILKNQLKNQEIKLNQETNQTQQILHQQKLHQLSFW